MNGAWAASLDKGNPQWTGVSCQAAGSFEARDRHDLNRRFRVAVEQHKRDWTRLLARLEPKCLYSDDRSRAPKQVTMARHDIQRTSKMAQPRSIFYGDVGTVWVYGYDFVGVHVFPGFPRPNLA